MLRKFLSTLTLLLVLGVLASAAPTAFDKKFNRLQKNMSITQVQTILGGPDLRELRDNIETWHFNDSGGRRVIFVDGIVNSFGADDKTAQQQSLEQAKPTPTQAPGSVIIGQTCSYDADCKSKNCHFHLCSGANNCSIPIGKICATDDQCCDGKCDFQICKKR